MVTVEVQPSTTDGVAGGESLQAQESEDLCIAKQAPARNQSGVIFVGRTHDPGTV